MRVKISVIVPTYRRPQFLCQCLEALTRQSLDKKNFEIIVISDGPDETTLEALKSFQEREDAFLQFFSTPSKKGPAAARNFGLSRARGDLIAFTDDDCIPKRDWLENILNEYKGEEEIVFTGQVKVPIPPNPTDYELNVFNLETAEFVTANCTCTKKALLKVKGFDENFRAAWREDSDLHFKFIVHNIPIRKIKATVVHPVRPAPWGISIKEQKKGIFNALLYKKYPELFRQRIKPAPSWNYYFMTLSLLGVFVGVLNQLNWLSAAAAITWAALLFQFIRKRLSLTSWSSEHILEITVTSIFIPILSVYWQLYGSLKYRVLYL